MHKIPYFLLTQTVTVEKYAGKNAYGYAFDPPVSYRCFVEPDRAQVRTLSGDETITNFRAFLNPLNNSDDVPPLSKVTYNGVVYVVQSAGQRMGFTLSHIELRF